MSSQQKELHTLVAGAKLILFTTVIGILKEKQFRASEISKSAISVLMIRMISMNLFSTQLQTTLIFLSMIIFATALRILLPFQLSFPINFSPLDAIALLSGAFCSKRVSAFFICLFSVWIGDIFLNRIYFSHWQLFYPGFYWQYSSYLLIAIIGSLLRNRMSLTNLLFASLSSSLLFFIISNFGVWYSGFLYPFTLNGLMDCYIAALPFLKIQF